MPHRSLRRPQRNARLRQVRAEGVPQGMDVDRAAAVVGLDDDLLAAATLDTGQPGEDQVAVEDPDQPFGQFEQRLVARRCGGDRRVAANTLAISRTVTSASRIWRLFACATN